MLMAPLAPGLLETSLRESKARVLKSKQSRPIKTNAESFIEESINCNTRNIPVALVVSEMYDEALKILMHQRHANFESPLFGCL